MTAAPADPTPLDGLLVPHPHRVELTGKLRSLSFPSRCANCGAVAIERLPIRKVFGRMAGRRVRSSRYRGYRIDTARVPYCDACIALDARERDSLLRRWRARIGSLLIQSLPAVLPIGFAIYLLTTIRPSESGDPSGSFVSTFALVFGVAGACLVAHALWDTRRYMVPRQTSVTLAFDFSPDVSDLLDRKERRVYAMRDPAFAEAFTALNRDRLWQPDPAAERAEMRVWIACAVFLALGALVAAWLNR
ncbi:MAG TPA: hypothetical protein VJQ46_08850 [Gemmatimonadales bacterium]|nr:hypothetical protein [Gemmatimonadales bacterium]